MKLTLEPEKYVVAVSGGVDSTVLLHLLSTTYYLPPTKFVVAHFDHGIREDSAADRIFVERLAESYGLAFFFEEGKLSPKTSEAQARHKRYQFLGRVKEKTGSKAIITAHHQDDLIETAILNLLRGTKHKGLVAMQVRRDDIKRPLLQYSKTELIKYARANNLKWREDSTNLDLKYRRNYIRHQIVPKFSDRQRREFLQIIDRIARIDRSLEAVTKTIKPGPMYRRWFVGLPNEVASQIMAVWLRKNKVVNISSKMIESLTVYAKTLRPGQSVDVDKNHYLKVGQKTLALQSRERY